MVSRGWLPSQKDPSVLYELTGMKLAVSMEEKYRFPIN